MYFSAGFPQKQSLFICLSQRKKTCKIYEKFCKEAENVTNNILSLYIEHQKNYLSPIENNIKPYSCVI